MNLLDKINELYPVNNDMGYNFVGGRALLLVGVCGLILQRIRPDGTIQMVNYKKNDKLSLIRHDGNGTMYIWCSDFTGKEVPVYVGYFHGIEYKVN